MKKIGIIIGIILLINSYSFAQKFGYVDSDYILSKMPEYAQAQSEIDKLSQQWETEIKDMYKQVEAMEAKLKAEEVLLTIEMRDDRDSDIELKWTEVKDYQKKVFGFDGLFFLKKKELIKPIQDKVFEAVEKVAKSNRLQIVFDKSGELVMIYTDPIHDYTDFVLEEFGLGDKNDTVSN